MTCIDRYAFLDEKKKVKIYIEIDGIGELQDKVSCEFEVEGFTLLIQDEEMAVRKLCVDDLNNPVVPEKSKFTVKPNKIIVSLHKEAERTWYKLKKGA